MTTIRPCGETERSAILSVINAAAQRYCGVIPPDRWRDPYMSAADLDREIAAGVTFRCCEIDDLVVGVMGVQPVADVVLIRHAYVSPDYQGKGVGTMLLQALRADTAVRMLVGTWAAADWAIRFYERHGFALVPADHAAPLLRRYWTVPERQIATSVVLVSSPRELVPSDPIERVGGS